MSAKSGAVRLNEDQHAVLTALGGASDGDPRPTIEELAASVGRPAPHVTAILTEAEGAGWVEIESNPREEVVPGERAQLAASGELPERRALDRIVSGDGRLAMADVVALAKSIDSNVGEIVKWGKTRGWYSKEGGDLVASEEGKVAASSKDADEMALRQALAKDEPFYLDQLGKADADRARKLLKNRGDVAKVKKRNIRRPALTPAGLKLLTIAEVVAERSVLTHEDIVSGAWADVVLKPYDVTLAAEVRRPAKMHPMARIVEETRRAFLRMGFDEIVSPMIESAFWNFDALFQPQDHPARDMQDTFYLSRPATARLPEGDVVDRVRRTHEDGGDVEGSSGWGYTWSPDEARRTVLRTHTTATTIRAIAEHPAPPGKYFCVGRVFRNETVSYKHLPEFTQVDGIIIDETATFRYLLGTLAEFYRQMGFEKVKFKPSFFPYTEPSAEVFVYFEPKESWIELGGSGVFRPEVTEPLGCDVPVLAWGLGLERLAMLRYNLADIRELYFSDLDFLREVPLCR